MRSLWPSEKPKITRPMPHCHNLFNKWVTVRILSVTGQKITLSRSQWQRDLRRVSAAVSSIGLLVWIPKGPWRFVCCECCVLSGRGLCDGLIPRREETNWMCVCVCVLLSGIRVHNKPLHKKRLGRRGQTKNERNLLYWPLGLMRIIHVMDKKLYKSYYHIILISHSTKYGMKKS
jgi:hypothetical protein